MYAFRNDGSVLLGLRYPLASDGQPIIVDVDDIQNLFDPNATAPEVKGFWVADAVGRDGTIAGVRDLALVDDELHVVTGNIDSKTERQRNSRRPSRGPRYL